jgi:rhodanese-related sulfurtransferase
VDSVLVAFERYAPVDGESGEPRDTELRRRTFDLVDAAFGQRRKMLRQALSDIFGSSAAASDALERASIAPTRRGEELVLDDFVRLARVGLDRVEGFLEGGFEAWAKAGEAIDLVINIEADELAMDIPFDERLLVVDVRKETEFADGHVVDAMNLPLGELTDPGSMAALEEDQNLYVHCGGGYRSVIACSLLKRQGFHNLRNVLGGWSKIKEQEGIPTVKESTVLN